MSQQKIYPIGRVYAIRSPNTDEVYIGSTFNPLYKRFGHHKCYFKKYEITGIYSTTSYKIIEAGGAYIELMEQHENLTKEQLNKFEGEHIRYVDNCVNRCVAGRTKKEYYQDNRTHTIEKSKLYAINNKEKIVSYKADLYQSNKEVILAARKETFKCDCGGECRKSDKVRHEKTKKHLDYLASLEN